MLEAQACGLPCVGIRGSFMDANVMVGLDQWAARNVPEDLAGAIERYADFDLAAMGAEASRMVHARFSLGTRSSPASGISTPAPGSTGAEALRSSELQPFASTLAAGGV